MIVGKLARQLLQLGENKADVADGLGLTAARIRDTMAAPNLSSNPVFTGP